MEAIAEPKPVSTSGDSCATHLRAVYATIEPVVISSLCTPRLLVFQTPFGRENFEDCAGMVYSFHGSHSGAQASQYLGIYVRASCTRP